MIVSKVGVNMGMMISNPRSAKVFDELMKMLEPEAGEKLLDLGCGDGTASFLLSGKGLKVTGIDCDHEKVTKARNRGIEALVINAESLFFDKDFDVVFSLNALDRMRRPEMVIDGVWRALKPVGRFVGEIAGEANNQALNSAIIDILEKSGKNGRYLLDFYQPTVDDYREKLKSKGFIVKSMELLNYYGDIGGTLEDFFKDETEPFAQLFNSSEDFAAFCEEVKAAVIPSLKKDKGKYQIGQSSIIFQALKRDE